ncbi:lipopolysaccharide heptosyltransferase II [Methylovulum psychrotolerans]|uniref:lipopolysaccharide heptosyltransferase II n=2 Tax=Methylovulum psychrotolerans TaxID=1704499 RepID=A0A2S5CPX6_9GAMM|nr:lipopolysaccharide heptosyltransferase II [Methylovulum psychrotolerans]
MVMAQSLFLTLQANAPDCLIDVLAPAWTFGLLERMPQVNRAIAMPLGHGQLGLWERVTLGKQLRADAYQQAVVLPNSWKSALTPFFADIPQRTGYVGECRWGLLNDARQLNKQQLPMTVQRFAALGHPKGAHLPTPYPLPRLAISPAQQHAVQVQFKLNAEGLAAQKILALCPGAEYGEAKRWPTEHYAELARHQLKQGWQVWLFGSAKDQTVAADINRATLNACLDFTGKTSLAEAVDLLSLTDAVVSNDSGLMHVAAALDKPVIAIYGSSDPGFTPPLTAKAQIISLNLACAPCFKRVCPLGHTACLQGIRPEQVQELLPP